MAASNLNLGKASGGVLNVQPADGTTNTSIVLPSTGTVVSDATLKTINGNSLVGSGDISLINLSSVTAYHLLQGNLAIDSSVITQGFNTTLYTGNGSTQSITTGIDMSTQWGNDVSEKFGGLVWVKSRSAATNHGLIDTVRGVGKVVSSSTTSTETADAGALTSFNSNGFSVANSTFSNNNLATYASWNFQTTHRVTGTTNHGQTYECHYNPFTGFTMVKYTGSGIAGHEIPHNLGRKLGFVTVKNLSAVSDWTTYPQDLNENAYLYLNTTASLGLGSQVTGNKDTFIINANASSVNASSNTYIMYGWANSYFDKSNKLIGNYEIGVYQGTGAEGNKVTTRDKPAWIMYKRLDSSGYWGIFDNKRNEYSSNFDGRLMANLSDGEVTGVNYVSFVNDGFILNNISTDYNASDGQYLYMVVYDTNSNGGGSYYPLASDTANVQVNNALIPIAQGIDSNGAKNTILSKNETVTGITYTQGKNYVYYDVLGNKGVSAHRPRYLESELVRTYAGESPDYYDVKKNKWYSTNSGSELLGTTGWTATGGTLTTVGGYNQFVDTTLTGYVSKAISTVVGKSYTIVFKTFGTREANIKINNVIYQWVNGTFIGTKTINFVANSVSTDIVIDDGSGSSNTIQFSASMFETAITPTTEITNGRNYLNHIVYADNDGGLLYVEELPKTQYIDSLNVGRYNINFSNSLFTNGYQKLPSGLILQWGKNGTGTIGATTGTFPIAFPTVCVGVYLQRVYSSVYSSGLSNYTVTAPTTTSFGYYRDNAIDTYFFAIGY